MNNLRKAQFVLVDLLKQIDNVCRSNGIEYWLDGGTLLGAVRHGGFIPWDDDVDLCMTREHYDKFIEVAKSQLGEKYFVQTMYTDKHYVKYGIPCKVRVENTHIDEDRDMDIGINGMGFHHGIFIDIFPVDKYSVNKTVRKAERLLSIMYRLKFLSFHTSHASIKRRIVGNLFKCVPIGLLEYWKGIQQKKMNKRGKYVTCHGVETPFHKVPFVESDLYPLKTIEFEGFSAMCPNDTHSYLVKSYGEDYMTPPPKHMRHKHGSGISIGGNV